MTHERLFEIRDLHFDLSPDTPRYWHGGRRSVTLYFDGLSLFFPHGERFFVASVKAHRDRVKDERLLEDVRLFCGQEGVHGREHASYNRMLQAQGYPAVAMERRVHSLLARVTRRVPPRVRLAVTAALEHFTAILAHVALAFPEQFEGAHPVMAALWRWHAVEESEHKAVAFDVYRAAGGNYVERTIVMLMTTLIFLAKMAEHQIRLMWVDRILFSVPEWADLLRFVFFSRGSWHLVRGYFTWYRPGFHPDDVDDRYLLDAWKEQQETAGTYVRKGPAIGAVR